MGCTKINRRSILSKGDMWISRTVADDGAIPCRSIVFPGSYLERQGKVGPCIDGTGVVNSVTRSVMLLKKDMNVVIGIDGDLRPPCVI